MVSSIVLCLVLSDEVVWGKLLLELLNRDGFLGVVCRKSRAS